MKKKLQVFVSSTYTDLRDERQAAVMAILKAGHIPAGMELFSSGDESQMEIIKRWIDESEVYMLILGGRYGSIEPNTSLSYIELEYDYAMSQNKPTFAVVINEKELDRRVKKRGKDVIEIDRTKEYKLFREKVLGKISTFFDDEKDVRLAVHETLSDFIVRYEFKGWISSSEIQDTQPLFEEIKRLSEENKKLSERNKEISDKLVQSPPSGHSKVSMEELIRVLGGIAIEHDINKTGKIENKSLLDLLYIFRDSLVTGIANRMGMTDIDKFLYFNVCPKLQIHGIANNESVTGVQWRRFSLTKLGLDLLAHIDKRNLSKK